ncbi:MAG: hypothetical protein KDA70_18815, partial [Planctomycetaceae bacterium]|nr:hypothetical protein [Planctomycetaceae bacterium]
MIKANTGLIKKRGTRPCPSDETLAVLLDDRCSDAQQAELISHLDDCESCRQRIENAAGDIVVWSVAHDSLQAEKVGGPGLDRVTTALKSIGHSTHGERKPTADAKIDFLQPCDKPDRIGQLDGYEICSLTGRGGMGFVFKAFDPKL